MTRAMIDKIFITFWILPWLGLLGDPTKAQKWSGILDESLDERHDAEIFRAVVESMRQWESHKKNTHRTKREASRVCYEEVGCFEDTGPFSYLEMLPSHPKDVGTRFFMYGSRKARSVPMEVPADDINDKANNAIDPDLPTKVIVHGFGSGCEHIWVYEMRSALMSVHDCNIVCVDWSPGSAIPNYVRAAANTRLVGRQLAKLVRSLNVPLEKVHLIGFSLGAHVAGFAGAELANVSRITGLDPAGPLFESQDPRARLDESDATFVDVIHSNGEQLILGGLGSWQPMGDVDFYPNGGRMQTGCSNLFLGAVSDIIWSGSIDGRSLCNHRRAYKLFTDSVSPKCRFPAFPCETGYDGLLKGECFPCDANGIDRPCGDMGYYSDASNARGQLYLVTREEEPFCAYQYQVKVYNSRGERPARSYGKLQVTLVGESNFNETFTMTRKDDEELLVGSILQKIVVPHPAVSSLEAIEIKYTAYSGWISSGLVSWSVDKISVLDSFGKSLSVCMRGLALESGRAVYLPLYPGECNIPLELENTTSTSTKSAAMKIEPVDKTNDDESISGIGPFTKEQNYDRQDGYASVSDVPVDERNQPQKGVGPFTKDQNTKLPPSESVQIAFVPKDPEEPPSSSDTKKSVSSPWSYVDVSDAGSNSLENTETESGRVFSGSSFIPSSTLETPSKLTDATTHIEFVSEVHEPVLQVTKKETGRSMRLPEITEPILRPRATRQNIKNEGALRDARQEDLQESSSSNLAQGSRGFTVQFLPERLVGILAQAERYARQTLLPLISQYTPSFVGSARQERVKYFPPLTDIDEDQPGTPDNGVVVNGASTTPHTTKSNEIDTKERQQSNISKILEKKTNDSSKSGKEMGNEQEATSIVILKESTDAPIGDSRKYEFLETSSAGYEKNAESKNLKVAFQNQQSDWIPIGTGNTDKLPGTTRSEGNSSRSLNDDNYNKWISEDGVEWNAPVEDVNAGPDTKIDDWVPIIDKTQNSHNPDMKTTSNATKQSSLQTEVTSKSPSKILSTTPITLDTTTVEIAVKLSTKASVVELMTEKMNVNPTSTTTARAEEEKKFIPLVDFEHRDLFLAPATANDVSANTESSFTSSTETPSHIQRIPGPVESKSRIEALATKRAMIFPYAYERKKDPRTRYIPLIPEEEMGRLDPLMERDR